MIKPYMGDIYRYLKNKEGKRIGEAAFEGDALCKEIIEKYEAHYCNQKCEKAASNLKEVLKDYANMLRNELGHWPSNTPLSLRIRKIQVVDETVDVFSIPPG
jgi:hypothetical protein